MTQLTGNSRGGYAQISDDPQPIKDSLLDRILALPNEQALKALWENPAYTFSVLTVLNKIQHGGVMITGGLGVDDGYIHLPETQGEAHRLVHLLEHLTSYPYRFWRGLDLFKCGTASLKVAATINPVSKLMSQSLLDFMLCTDLDASPGVIIPKPDVDWEAYTTISEDDAELAAAFRRQMVDEAEPHRHGIAAGAYVMDKEEFPRLDQEIAYRQLRLVISYDGIFGCLYQPAETDLIEWIEPEDKPRRRIKAIPLSTPFVWTPSGINTAQVWLSARAVFALDTLLACIWRDACIVKTKFTEQQRARGYEDRKRNSKQRNVVILPRVIYKSKWGEDQAERDQAVRQARAAHERGGCYPKLPPGYVAHDAEARADEWRYPPPPPGHTFRKPYTTTGEKPESLGYKKVICRGLQVAHHVLG